MKLQRIRTLSLAAASLFCLSPLPAQISIPITADRLEGSDIGAKVNTAFNAAISAGLSSAVVYLGSDQKYSYSTTIVLPSATIAFWPVLDCQGSTLTYTGNQDAIMVNGKSDNYTRPEIRNCIFNSRTAANIIHNGGRLFLNLHDLTFLSCGSVCILEDLTTTYGGPGYLEQNLFSNLQMGGFSDSGIKTVTNKGSTGSLEYTRMDNIHCELVLNTSCFNLQGTSVGIQGGWFHIKANYGSGTGSAYLINVGAGNVFVRSHVVMEGENTGKMSAPYAVNLATQASVFYNEGFSFVDSVLPFNLNGSQEGRYVLHPTLSSFDNDLGTGQSIHNEPEQGVAGQRHCKTDLSMTGGSQANGSSVFWLASYRGVEDDCYFQILKRNTDDKNLDVDITGSGTPRANVLYADSKTGYVGIGPGYNDGTSSNLPSYPLSMAGFHVDASGNATATSIAPGKIFATASLPPCASGTLLQRSAVNDATSATPGAAPMGGGSYTVPVVCIFNRSGSIYSWIID